MVDLVSIGPHEGLLVEEGGCAPSGLRFAAEGTPTLAPVLSLNVTPGEYGPGWCGEFFGGTEECSAVVLGVSVSAEPMVLVVAGGAGYLVPADRPEEFEVVALFPIREVLVSVKSGVAVLVGYTGLVAFGTQGELWASGRLVWDGFSGVSVGSEVVVVSGFDAPSGRDVEITLDLVSGNILSR